MTAKTFLSRAYRLDVKINTKLEQLEHLRSLAYKVTSVIRGDKVSESQPKSVMENAVIKIVMAENAINEAIDELIDTKTEISEMVKSIYNDDERILLELRYICFNTWEQITAKMNISSSYAFQLHRRALDSMDRLLVDQRRCANG